MKTISYIEQPLEPCVATIGFFDGVHLGHHHLITNVVDEARARELKSLVITFDRHPREVLQKDFQPKMLTTLDDKLLLLSKTEIDTCLVMPFTRQLSELSAREFMQWLSEKLNVKVLVTGYDNRFGHDRREGFDDYVRYGRELGIEVLQATPLVMGGINVSSSAIRRLVADGEVELAHKCLGYPYSLWSTVVHGEHVGTGLGFPTANLSMAELADRVIPAPGVYAVKVRLEGSVEWKHAMTNIGTRPTFDGQKLSMESHIFRCSDDLYGKKMLVSFMHRLRAEQRFDSREELMEQLKKDARMVEEQFEKEQSDAEEME